jgi:hypothetical protein
MVVSAGGSVLWTVGEVLLVHCPYHCKGNLTFVDGVADGLQ